MQSRTVNFPHPLCWCLPGICQTHQSHPAELVDGRVSWRFMCLSQSSRHAVPLSCAHPMHVWYLLLPKRCLCFCTHERERGSRSPLPHRPPGSSGPPLPSATPSPALGRRSLCRSVGSCCLGFCPVSPQQKVAVSRPRLRPQPSSDFLIVV